MFDFSEELYIYGVDRNSSVAIVGTVTVNFNGAVFIFSILIGVIS